MQALLTGRVRREESRLATQVSHAGSAAGVVQVRLVRAKQQQGFERHANDTAGEPPVRGATVECVCFVEAV